MSRMPLACPGLSLWTLSISPSTQSRNNFGLADAAVANRTDTADLLLLVLESDDGAMLTDRNGNEPHSLYSPNLAPTFVSNWLDKCSRLLPRRCPFFSFPSLIIC